jgi:hypothetical protein
LSEKGCKELENCRTADASAEQMAQYERHDFEGMRVLLGFSRSRVASALWRDPRNEQSYQEKTSLGVGRDSALPSLAQCRVRRYGLFSAETVVCERWLFRVQFS